MFDDSVKHPADFSQDSNTTEPTDYYSQFSAINDLEMMIEAIQEDAKERVRNLKEEINQLGYNFVLNAEDVVKAVQILYWQYPLVGAMNIENAAIRRGHSSSARIIAGKGYAELFCNHCQQPYTQPLNSRADAKTHFNRSWHICPTCDKERSASYWQKHATEQAEHQNIVQQLRAMPYSQYLRTEHWQDVRKRALKRANFACQLCNSRSALQVHHRTYENRGQEENRDVIALCANCHAKFHDKLAEVE